MFQLSDRYDRYMKNSIFYHLLMFMMILAAKMEEDQK